MEAFHSCRGRFLVSAIALQYLDQSHHVFPTVTRIDRFFEEAGDEIGKFRIDVSVDALFLDTLQRPVSSTPGEDLGGDVGRGKELFQRGDCHRCHRPPTYTIKETKDVGISDPHPDPRRRYNPPSLLGLRDRYRYLHDGRAETLWAVFREHNSEEKHGEAGAFSDCELRDLIAFLKTL